MNAQPLLRQSTRNAAGYARAAFDILMQSGRITVSSESMVPELMPGDRLTVEPVQACGLAIGDIVVVAECETFRVHRFLRRRGPGRIVTKGDALRYADTPARAENLVGRVTARERDGRVVELNAARMRILGIYNLVKATVFLLRDFFLR